MRLWPVQVIMRVELLYGLAGLVGSLVSGHLYLLLGSSLGNGTLLLIASIALHALSLLQAAVLLKVGRLSRSYTGRRLRLLYGGLRRNPVHPRNVSFFLIR